MKKIIFGISILAIAGVMAFNVNFNLKKSNNDSLLELANIEALATPEWWDNTDFFAVLTTIQIYNTNVSIAVGYNGFNIDLGNLQTGYLGYLRTCESHWIQICDKTEEGFFPA